MEKASSCAGVLGTGGTRMKIALLGDLRAIHFIRWVRALRSRDHEVHVFSSHAPREYELQASDVLLPLSPPWGYFGNAPSLRGALSRLAPDLLHVHFASGYGTLATLSGFHPRMLSVWGSDVYQFPDRSPLHRWWIAQIVGGADLVTATSHAMARRTRSLVQTDVEVVPFGIDIDKFSPGSGSSSGELTIGTARSLLHRYGLDILIQAFADFVSHEGSPSVRLLIAGDGPEEGRLRRLSAACGTADRVEFVGRLKHADMPAFLRRLDIFVMPSRYESFGVAALEACACEVPVIVSNVGGLPETVVDGVTGLIVERENVCALSTALSALAGSPATRRRLGRAGRARVIEHYTWGKCVDQMEGLYRRFAGSPA